MSLTQRLEVWLDANVWRFFRAVFNTNRDYPYRDYLKATSSGPISGYAVGTNNINKHGNQSKLFVSKSTLIYASAACTVVFNDSKNVVIDILPLVWYEFKSNIWMIFWDLGTDGADLYLYFEGVLPDEARVPH